MPDSTVKKIKIKIRYGLSTELNPLVLLEGELAYSIDTRELKIGNGVTSFEELAAITITDEQVDGKIAPILALIPAQASADNQLADKEFVNSSIATNTANFIGTFDSLEELEAYSGVLTKNDYAFVIDVDSSGNTVYNRYKYTGTIWKFEYPLNNSSFTAEQWAAINSGVTRNRIVKIEMDIGVIRNSMVVHSELYNYVPWANVSQNAGGPTVVQRKDDSTVDVRIPLTPVYDNEPTSKKYVEDNLARKADSSELGNYVNWSNVSQQAFGSTIVQRKDDATVDIRVPVSPTYGNEPASKQYADTKVPWDSVSYDAYGDTIVRRKSNSMVDIRVPLVPTYDDEPASKKYVDENDQILTESLPVIEDYVS